MNTSRIALVGYANDTSFVDSIRSKLDFPYASDSVAVVISHYNNLDKLAANLRNLAEQTYPLSKIEVVVADDGSSDSASSLVQNYQGVFSSCRLVTQEDLGYRLSAVRNLGISNTSSEYVILLDCDMVPHKGLVGNHMSVLQVSKKLVSIGFRMDGASLDDVESGSISRDTLDWRYQKLMQKGREFFDLTNQPYTFTSGGNIAFHKSAWSMCKYDESFTSWGGEDNEWGYRLTQLGYYFYPNTEALCWHLSDPTYSRVDRSVARALYERKCPGVSYENAKSKTTDTPYLSFWITSYNKGAYIESAIASVTECKLSHEIVVVDNGSTDASLEIIKRISESNPNVRFVTEKRRGPHHAYEKALSECRGELLVQLDADDLIVLSALESLIVEMFYEPQGLLYGLTKSCSIDLQPLPSSVWIPNEENIRDYNILKGMSIRNPRVVRKRDLSRTRPRDVFNSAVDYCLYSKLLFVTKPFRFRDVTYIYRTGTDNSISKTLSEDQRSNALHIAQINAASMNTVLGSDTLYNVDHLELNTGFIPKEVIEQMVQECGFKY